MCIAIAIVRNLAKDCNLTLYIHQCAVKVGIASLVSIVHLYRKSTRSDQRFRACEIPPIRGVPASSGSVPIQSISAWSLRSDLPINNDWPINIQNIRPPNLNLHPGGDQSRRNWYQNGIKMDSNSRNVSPRYHLRHLNAGPLTLLVARDSVLGWWQW